jgi:hypothetical protein
METGNESIGQQKRLMHDFKRLIAEGNESLRSAHSLTQAGKLLISETNE